jgi:hypothetical protein
MTTQVKQTKEQFQSLPVEEMKALTASTIGKYIETVRQNQRTRVDLYNLEFVLHCFLRTGIGDDYHYDENQMGVIKGVTKDLLAFFVDDEVSKKFRELYPWTADTIAEALTKVVDLCEALEEEKNKAFLEKFDVENYSDDSADKLWCNHVYYMREIEIEKARGEAVRKYSGMFS